MAQMSRHFPGRYTGGAKVACYRVAQRLGINLVIEAAALSMVSPSCFDPAAGLAAIADLIAIVVRSRKSGSAFELVPAPDLELRHGQEV